MKEHKQSYTRRTKFCQTCVDKMNRKFMSRKRNQRLLAKKAATTSLDDRTTSYSNASNPGKRDMLAYHFISFHFHMPYCIEFISLILIFFTVLSQTSSSRSSSRNQTGGNRNVAKRTVGPPTNRSGTTTGADADDDANTDTGDMAVHIPVSSSNHSSQQQQRTSSSSTTRRSNRSHTSNIDLGNDDYDDDDDDGGNANQTGGNGSVSSQAPMPSNRHQRTQSLSSSSAALSPTRMASMTSTDRSDTFRNYNRGGGG